MDPITAERLQSVIAWLVAVSQHPFFYPAIALFTVFSAVIYGVYVVVTARPKAESEVAELLHQLDSANAKLVFAEEVGHIGSFTWDFADGTQSFWSHEMYQLFGMEPRKSPPSPEEMEQCIHAEDREDAMREWQRAFKGSGDFSLKFRTVAVTGQVRYLAVQGKAVTGKDGNTIAVTGVAHDVTKEMEIDRAKTEFVSLASHQLKTPLTSINWLSEALMSPKLGTLTPEQRKYISSIHDASEHMVEMVNDLLNVSRLELGTLALRIEEVDVPALAREVLDEQKHTADDKKIVVQFNTDSSLTAIRADRNLMRMVLQNLISNAIKYTPPEGTVEIELAPGSIEAGSIFLRVKDTGMGIPADVQHKIFERLYRAPNATAHVPDGTGLGLYLVKMIVERVGGGISFESHEGQGTTFYVTVPPDWSHAFGGKLLVKTALDPKTAIAGDKTARNESGSGILTRIWKTLARARS